MFTEENVTQKTWLEDAIGNVCFLAFQGKVEYNTYYLQIAINLKLQRAPFYEVTEYIYTD